MEIKIEPRIKLNHSTCTKPQESYKYPTLESFLSNSVILFLPRNKRYCFHPLVGLCLETGLLRVH